MAPGQRSPSPSSALKRPSLSERTSSAHSLSSSGKQVKLHRPHIVGQRSHGRNTSYGKNLNKLPKINSTQVLTAEGAVRNLPRRRSGPSTSPPTSPKVNVNKRNSSYVSLKKNNSHTALKKNHSATALARNSSATHLKKAGLAPLTPARPQKEKQVGFQFGNGEASSDDEEEAEWEDSSHSPETTRQNSAHSTHPTTPVDGHSTNPQHHRHSSPPQPFLKAQHRSAPSLAAQNRNKGQAKKPPDLTLLNQNPRSAHAPPAMSTISATATKSQTNLRANMDSVSDSKPTTNGHPSKKIPNGGASTSTSAENGVSRFLSTTGSSGKSPYLGVDPNAGNEDDYDSPSSFLPNYHPQRADSSRSSETPRNISSRRSNEAPVFSRTQQRLELQRRETMRTGTPTPPSHGPGGLSSPHDSTLQMSRPGSSRARTRGVADGIDALDAKSRKKEFDSATKHLNVVRRFRNPVTESLLRLQSHGSLLEKESQGSKDGKDSSSAKKGKSKASTTGTATHPTSTGRTPSRAGPVTASGRKSNGLPNGTGGALNSHQPNLKLSRSLEERDRRIQHHQQQQQSNGGPANTKGSSTTRPTSGTSSSGGRQRVRFQPQRQGSHDEIGLSRSRGETDDEIDDVDDEEDTAGEEGEETAEEEMEEDEGVGMGVTGEGGDGGRRKRAKDKGKGKGGRRGGKKAAAVGDEQELLRRIWGARVWVG
ncbi:MAG: hypothetical protein Q9160_002057 [Pyrenula sp. 1 TL-2023]